MLSPRGSRRILRGTCGNLHAMQCNGHLAHSRHGRFYNAINKVVEVHHGSKCADMRDVVALPHFGRTERALSRHRGPNDVCSFSSPFLSLAFSISLLRSVHICYCVVKLTVPLPSRMYAWSRINCLNFMPSSLKFEEPLRLLARIASSLVMMSSRSLVLRNIAPVSNDTRKLVLQEV